MIGVVVSRAKPAAPPRITSSEVIVDTATSSEPLPSKSAPATLTGPPATATGDPAAGVNVPMAVRSRIETVLSEKFDTARSVRPSPSKSPAVMPLGRVPTATGVPSDANVPPPVFARIDTEFDSSLVTAMSGPPSPLKSATAIWRGCTPTAWFPASVNPSLPGLRSNTDTWVKS